MSSNKVQCCSNEFRQSSLDSEQCAKDIATISGK